MNSAKAGNSTIQAAMAAYTSHPDYDALPESIKSLHTEREFAWLGSERDRIIERETMPDMDVTE